MPDSDYPAPYIRRGFFYWAYDFFTFNTLKQVDFNDSYTKIHSKKIIHSLPINLSITYQSNQVYFLKSVFTLMSQLILFAGLPVLMLTFYNIRF